ncbi:DUF2975 domain-containing protein [Pedobacter jamesrossensis]|uniref:DUF2975 domain-containing protein n=1 Tax=Pedobacter jamesrossensis TaxID=1908238 RepID=A0ABV8NFU1_9SPHI
MKNSRSLTFYKFLIDSSWYLGIAVCCIWAILCFISIVSEDKIIGTDLVEFELKLKTPHPNITSIGETYNFTAGKQPKLIATLSDFNSSKLISPFALTYFAFIIVGLIFSFYQLEQMKDLINDVIKGNIFITENVGRLKRFGIVELLYIPISIVYYYSTYFIFQHSTNFNHDLSVSMDGRELSQLLVHGLEYLIFAGIFALGLKLKQENDLTI